MKKIRINFEKFSDAILTLPFPWPFADFFVWDISLQRRPDSVKKCVLFHVY